MLNKNKCDTPHERLKMFMGVDDRIESFFTA